MRRSTNTKMKTTSLPTDLLTEIFAKLPVKPLIRFRCVSKSWYSIITNPEFAQFHVRCYKNNAEAKFLISDEYQHKYYPNLSIRKLVVRRTETFRKVKDLNSTHKQYKFFDCTPMVGYVNGVLLMHKESLCSFGDKRPNRILLWNPSIRKTLEIPLEKDMEFEEFINFGFGYDSSCNAYKIVSFNTREYDNSYNTRVYDLRAPGSWSKPKASSVLPHKLYSISSKKRNFEGRIHCMGCLVKHSDSPFSHLLSFDLSSEVFTCHELPKYDSKWTRCNRNLLALSESLVLLDIYNEYYVYVWAWVNCGTTEPFWKKQHMLNLHIRDFLYWKKNDEILLRVCRKGVCLYDINKLQQKIVASNHRHRIWFMDTYVESLVLLGEEQRHSEAKKTSNNVTD